MSSLITKLQLPGKEVIYKELKLKQYKTILKCLVSTPIDRYNLFLNLNTILVQITNLTEEEILNLNLLEYLLLLTEIRVTSIGSSIFAVYKGTDESINIEIPLQKTLEEIQKCLNGFKQLQLDIADIKLNFVIPKVKNLISNKPVNYTDIDINELPARYLKIINKSLKEFNSYFKKYYFFKPPIEKYSVKLSASINEFTDIIRILFNENLLSVYNNIYYLSKFCNMSAEYLENCTYGEFKIFVKKTEELLLKNTKNITTNIEENHYEEVDINSLYGNDLSISNSEFTP